MIGRGLDPDSQSVRHLDGYGGLCLDERRRGRCAKRINQDISQAGSHHAMSGKTLSTSAIITYSNRLPTLSPRLDLSGFLPRTEMKREVWLLRTGFGIAPVNKLVSLTWLLWALRSFRSFTLHYI